MHSNLMPTIVKRSETGPFIREPEFERALSKRTAELVKQHGLKFNAQVPVPSDDDMADRLYQAGLELFIDLEPIINRLNDASYSAVMRSMSSLVMHAII